MWMETEKSAEWMQSVAAEMNQSETAFVRPTPLGMELRWFTPTVEVDLCGHATLASAHIMWENGLAVPGEPIEFQTRSGTLRCSRDGDFVALDFPATPPQPLSLPSGFLESLGRATRTQPSWVGKTKFDFFVVLPTERDVLDLSPDFAKLGTFAIRGVIATAQSENEKFDFISRFFAPASGINEDPVTGSAHCSLGPFWAERLRKSSLLGYQASRRGGSVRVDVHGDRVSLLGKGITVWSGHWRV